MIAAMVVTKDIGVVKPIVRIWD